MPMSTSRPPWPVIAVLSLGVLFRPTANLDPPPGLNRLVAARDPAFFVPDSVRALLTRVTSLVSDPDSSLYLADPSLGAVLNLTPAGDFRRAIGRRGSGPGEFNSVFLVGLHGDSLWVVDPATVRLTLMPLRGSGALTVPLGASAVTLANRSRPQARRGFPSAVLPDGNLLIEEGVRETTGGEPGQWNHNLLLRATRNLEILDTVARTSLAHSSMVFSYRDGESHYRQPFSDDPLYAVSSDGSLLIVVDRQVPKKGLAGTIRITGWRDAREQVFQREIDYTGIRLPNTVVDSAVNLFVGSPLKGAPPSPVNADSIRRRLFRPPMYPPVEAVRVARDGSTWLKVHFFDSPEGVGDWLVLSRRGFEMYRVTLPASFQMLEANRRTVWGLQGDLLDVPLPVRYTIPDRPV